MPIIIGGGLPDDAWQDIFIASVMNHHMKP